MLLISTFNQKKALVGDFSVIVKLRVIFAKLREDILSVDILSVDISSVDIVHVPAARHVTGTGSAICGTSACLGLGTPAAASSHTTHNVWRNISWSRQV